MEINTTQIDLISDAYDIAFGYLEGSGNVCTYPVIQDILLETLVASYERGERSPLRLANQSIAAYEREMEHRTLTLIAVR